MTAPPTGPDPGPDPTPHPKVKPTPITIITGFLGSGKTTLILSLLPQLRALNPSYKLALVKNEFGDVAIDSQLASSSAIAGVSELLNGCICCNLVGQLGPALAELRDTAAPDRVVVETSGSAFPATLAMEVNRLARETGGAYVLDGVVSVIDVENWAGYEDTSYTARLQARYTDLVVLNKWEGVGERRVDEVLDRVGDLEVDVAWVKSVRGWVDAGVVFGVDGGLAGGLEEDEAAGCRGGQGCVHAGGHAHGKENHQSEVEVLSVELKGETGAAVDAEKLMGFLRSAPKDEVYRIKAVLTASSTVANSDEDLPVATQPNARHRYILNWAFGRWTFTPMGEEIAEHESSTDAILRMTVILARYESTKWKKKLDAGGLVELAGIDTGTLTVTKVNT
ncbi:cobW-domain-containing protein [Trichocladium antarcticum]|uniref:CobW-domain-containing protein n=1 Tax=Trichocladium antarcticum TaxID=1450529 RepID=A0AAN6ZI39_9PEZI|nr:cobW-domain-containing protein [Trichocladium antarcticum]